MTLEPAADGPPDARLPLPRPPGIGAAGGALWDEITATYELRPDERRRLTDACAEADLIDRLAAKLDEPGETLIVRGSQGQPVAHPMVAELRSHRTALSSLLAGLGLEEADKHAGKAAEDLTASEVGRKMARARWDKPGARSGA